MARMPVQFRLNGSDRAVFVEPAETLLGTIRRGLGDFAPKFGCGQGTCGVCTVLVDGEPRLGCLTLSVTCEGRSIETASGLADGPTLHPLQAAFMEHFAAQCGFCTPGMLM
ncbi:MAG: 2Fe-2S iron-sulfur cluster-binding protein, partial [Bradyrhizobium sp.]|nr:2Fe-2S iron-sulfur cluster-binding protein [Bradyrhizobium sp.]